MWGQLAGGAHRFISFDKSNGQTIWVSAPEGRPTDTIYANPYIADVNGVRTFFSGGSDGAMHAHQGRTRESRSGTGGQPARPEHGGADARLRHHRQPQRREPRHERHGHAGGGAGGVEGHARPTRMRAGCSAACRPATPRRSATASGIYLLDNGGVLFASTLKTGNKLWSDTLGTIAKASPILADGKLYIGTENTGDAGGKFFIIRPHADEAEILDQDWLGTPAEVRADHRVADRGARTRLRDVDGCALRDRPEGSARGCPASRRRRSVATTAAPAGTAPTAIARHADRVDPEARRHRRSHGAGCSTRTATASTVAGERDLDGRESEGHGRQRQVHRGRRRRRAGRRRQGGGRQRDRRCRASASSPTCRGRSTSRTSARPAGALDQRDRQVRGPRRREATRCS